MSLEGVRLLKNRDDKIKVLKAALKESEEEVSLLKEKLSILELKDTKPVKKRKLRPSKKHFASSFILGFTDNHFTQIVDPELSGGNLHNETIAQERIHSILDQADSIVSDTRKKSGVADVLIWLGGDSMVNADLHPHFRRITPYEPHEELGVVEAIFIDIFDKIVSSSLYSKSTRVHCSLSNHGRDGKKDEVSAEIAFRRSFDVTLYRHVLTRYDIPFHIEPTYWGVENVGGVKTMLHHGHRLSMKENKQGVTVPNWNQIKKRLAHPRHVDTKLWIQGHYHTATEIINEQFTFVSAGSTVGQDGYSYDLLFPDNNPSQPLIEIRDGRVYKVHRLEC